VEGNSGEYGTVQLDRAGNPQLLILFQGNVASARVRKFNQDLSSIVFDTQVTGFLPFQMLIDSDGTTTLLGGTDASNLPQLHPTAACHLPSAPQTLYFSGAALNNGGLARLDRAGVLMQSTFLPGTPGLGNGYASPGSATVLIADNATRQVAILTLAAQAEIQSDASETPLRSTSLRSLRRKLSA
jgi:hypothetical protein